MALPSDAADGPARHYALLKAQQSGASAQGHLRLLIADMMLGIRDEHAAAFASPAASATDL